LRGNPVDEALVREEMERILATKQFVLTATLANLLRFLVDHALAGGPSADETAIAAKVFGRGADFVPQVDPVVHVQYRRLKGALERYYEAGGRPGQYVLTTSEDGFSIGVRDRAAVAAQRKRQRPKKLAAAVAVVVVAAGAGLWIRFHPHLADARQALALDKQAREYLAVDSPSYAARSVDLFEQAVAADADYAPAWSGLAAALIVPGSSRNLSRTEALAKARDAAEAALKLDTGLGQPHAVIGYVKLFHDFDWTGAEAEFRRAIELEPSVARTHRLYAQGLMSRGRFDEAIAQSKLASSLAPAGSPPNTDMSEILCAAHRPEEAIAEARRVLQATNGSPGARLSLGITLSAAGHYDEAIQELQTDLLGNRSLYALARLGYAYGAKGDQVAAQSVLNRLNRSFTQMATADWSLIAMVYAGMGDKQHALFCLEHAAAQRESDMLFVGVEPAYENLHSDPRFTAIKASLKLP
jgi:tetratricopeptide (TPR) repeat protein